MQRWESMPPTAVSGKRKCFGEQLRQAAIRILLFLKHGGETRRHRDRRDRIELGGTLLCALCVSVFPIGDRGWTFSVRRSPKYRNESGVLKHRQVLIVSAYMQKCFYIYNSLNRLGPDSHFFRVWCCEDDTKWLW